MKTSRFTRLFSKAPHINTDAYRKTLQEKQIALNLNSGDDSVTNSWKLYLTLLMITSWLSTKQIQIALSFSPKKNEGIETARHNDKQIGQQRGRKLHIKKKNHIKELILKYSKHFNDANKTFNLSCQFTLR